MAEDISKFVWRGKELELNIKCNKLQSKEDDKTWSHILLPVVQLGWILLKNRRLLVLEGHNLRFGWHQYQWNGS